MALEQNREVFAVPHSIYHPGGQGCLKLLREGAKLTETLQDLLEEVGALTTAVAASAATRGPEPPEPPAFARRVWAQIGFEPVSVDQLVAEGAGDVATVVAALQALEIAGLVEQSSGLFMRSV
jgi:DNA processing protein